MSSSTNKQNNYETECCSDIVSQKEGSCGTDTKDVSTLALPPPVSRRDAFQFRFSSLYMHVRKQMSHLLFQGKLDNQAVHNMLFVQLQSKMHQSQSRDLAVMEYIFGIRHLSLQTGINNTMIPLLKHLLKYLGIFQVHQPSTIMMVANIYIALYYSQKKKFGKAWHYLEIAQSSVQHDVPSEWTSQVYVREATLLSLLAHLYSSNRKQLYKKACDKLLTAAEHILNHNSSDHEGYSINGIFVYYAFYKLEMPSVALTDFFSGTTIVLQHASSCTLKDEDVEQVEQILKRINMTESSNSELESDTLAVHMYKEMRKAQIQFQKQNFEETCVSVWKAMEYYFLFRERCRRRYDEIAMILEQFPQIIKRIKSDVARRSGLKEDTDFEQDICLSKFQPVRSQSEDISENVSDVQDLEYQATTAVETDKSSEE